MKSNRNLVLSFVLLILVASLYRVMPGRPMGFAPQIAMALFAGSVIRNRKYAFALPLLSMFVSDLIFQLLYIGGAGTMPGFYEGQFINYVLLTSLTCIGFFVRERNVFSILSGALAGPTVYFLLSNFLVWINHGGYQRPKTWEGLISCYNDGLPFYRTSIYATVIFSAFLFGAYYITSRSYKASTIS